MIENKMFSQRAKKGNIPVMRYCGYSCTYCAFQKFQKVSSCNLCRENTNHVHLEALQRRPPKTKTGEFLTVGLSGDVSFMNITDFKEVIEYCAKWNDRTFLIQSKDPAYFVAFEENGFTFPDNVILGTTIETNRNKEIWTIHDPLKIRIDYADLSNAPVPYLRTTAMVQLSRTAVTIEPIMDFDLGEMLYWMGRIRPGFIYVGYCNDGKQGKKLKLPEPSLETTQELIDELQYYAIEVREKSLRKAWWEA